MNQVSVEDRVQNLDETPESPRNLIIERLQTELSDREQEHFLREVQLEIAYYCLLCFILLFVFILLEIQPFVNFGIEIPFLPLIILESGLLIFRISKLLMNKNENNEISQVLTTIGDLIFWIMVFMYLKTRGFNATLLIVPLVFFNSLKLLFRKKPSNGCLLFTFNLTLILRIVQVITVLFISIKLENYTEWLWYGILWPIWITIGFLYICSGFLLGISIGSICSYFYKDSFINYMIAHCWLFFTVAGCAIAVTLSLIRLVNQKNYTFFWIIVYLFMFLFLTIVFNKHICSWWVNLFFEPEQYSIPSLSASNQASLPISSYNSNRNKNLKLPPKALQRLTSTYFQPMEETKRNKKTLSDDFNDKKNANLHLRNFSSPDVERQPIHNHSSSDISFADKKCAICVEGLCNAVLMECGHGGICTYCAEFLLSNKGKCHMCRAEISQVLKIKIKKSKIVKVVGIK